MEITKLVALIVVFIIFLTVIVIGGGMMFFDPVKGPIYPSWISLLIGACVIYSVQRAFFCIYNN